MTRRYEKRDRPVDDAPLVAHQEGRDVGDYPYRLLDRESPLALKPQAHRVALPELALDAIAAVKSAVQACSQILW
jgi:hypothetical protein